MSRFGQAHESNREKSCSWVCAFEFYFNFWHHLVMLGPKQPCHKKALPREGWAAVGKGLWGELYEELSTGQLQQEGST